MRKLAALAFAVSLFAVTASGQDVPSAVVYTLELGGNNHVEDWENPAAMVTTAFTPGMSTDHQVFGRTVTGATVTWDVVVTSAGQTADGFPFQGLANLVFNLELYDISTGVEVPVTGDRFFSTMNDGDMDGWRRTIQDITDPYEKAAFCVGWDVDMNYDGVFDGVFGHMAGNPGRLFDPPTAAGPGMDRAQFPSNTYHGGGRLKGSDANYWRDCNGNNPSLALTDANGDGREDDLDEIALGLAVDADADGIIDDCENGLVSLPGTVEEPLAENKLSGMGVGYSEFKLNSNNIGVGIALGSGVVPVWAGINPGWYIGLNATPAIPVAEGQIDMTGLPGGTYKLKLTVPANGNNVIPADFVPTPDGGGGFAVEAEEVVTDEIIFHWLGPPPRIPLLWKSLRTHTNVGRFGITLDHTDGRATVEPRIGSGGQLQRIEVTFDGDLYLAGYIPNAVTYTGPAGLTILTSVETGLLPNDTLVLTIIGSQDQACYTFNIAGCVPVLKPGADPTCSVVVLGGDVTSSSTVVTRAVTNSDVTLTKQQVGKPVDATTCKFDVNCGGTIVNADVFQVKSRVGNTAAPCQ
jgi:hypothetical protein